MTKFRWSVKKIIVQEVLIRERFDCETLERSKYAVCKCSFSERGNDPADSEPKQRKRKKEISIMCFLQQIWTRLIPGERYSLRGEITFGYGNTYLCILEAFDSLGIDVESEDSYINSVNLCDDCFKKQRQGDSLPGCCEKCGRGNF